jgi:hypothetical protein
MTNKDSLEIRTLSTLLKETLMRADHQDAYLLNPDDPGLIETLKALSAETASTPPGSNRKPVVSHANHVLYGIELANRALRGEEGVYENADWNDAWKLEAVSEDQWRDLISQLEQQSKLLLEQVVQLRDWSEIMFTGVFAIAAHTAYHLGAIRQMLLDVAKS